MKKTPLRTALDRGVAQLLARVPALGRVWGRWATAERGDDRVPWTAVTRPLAGSRATLITTGGVHLAADAPFDMSDPDGDASFRVIPAPAAMADLRITHDYYDHRDADRDPNIVFPLERFRELVAQRVLGGLTAAHFGFMGHITGRLVRTLTEDTIPALMARLFADRPDFVLLVPA
ncbi:MAG: hypothetical protein HY216_16110 [Candidatus Rokubacteria bacterium]|nr:hypothetical protein [Candidatus Rokubacteria bacterium]